MRHRTLRAVASLVLLVGLAVPGRAGAAEVTDADLRRAADALDQARAEAGAAGQQLAAGRAEAARLQTRLEGVVGEMAAATARADAARREARERVRAMYVAAGAGPGGDASGTGAALRRAYAAAVSFRDREVATTLAEASADLDRWRRALQDGAGEQAALNERLEREAAAAGAGLREAEAEYVRVRAAWEAQEAARRAAAAAGDAPAATTTAATQAGSTTTGVPSATTTTIPAATTTTQPPPVDGGAFPPLVERWRPLVAVYFPAALVDEALAIIRCESLGEPAIVNPVSGAAGLFQHIPRYWPERAAAAGFAGASPFEAEANIAAAAWLVRVSMEDGLPAWYFWSCRP